MDWYGVLGVDEHATSADIAHAYRQQAMHFHPDRHPAASDDERAQLEAAMARVNNAHSVLGDPAQRAAYDQARRGSNVTTKSRSHPPTSEQCLFCGHEPVRHFDLVYNQAFVLARKKFSFSGNFCRSCARSLGRSAQNRTLITGWWGVISFFANLLAVLTNMEGLFRASRMPEPELLDKDVAAPLPGPMPAGNSVFQRAGVWIAVAVVATVTAIGVASGNADQANTTNSYPSSTDSPYVAPDSSDAAAPATWAVGNCVLGITLLEPVDCAEPNDGEIVDLVSAQYECPPTSDGYVTRAEGVYCIDNTP